MGSTIRDTAEAEDRVSRHSISWFPGSCVDGDEQWQCEKTLFVNMFLLFWFLWLVQRSQSPSLLSYGSYLLQYPKLNKCYDASFIF